MRNIPLKNYIILCMIILVSGIIAVALMNLFKSYGNYEESDAFIKLNYDELETYMLENPDFIIYFVNSGFKNSKFEKKLKKFAIKNDLNNQILYVDRNQFDETNFNEFISKYSDSNIKLKISDYIIVFDNQKIVSINQIERGQTDLSFLTKILNENEVI